MSESLRPGTNLSGGPAHDPSTDVPALDPALKIVIDAGTLNNFARRAVDSLSALSRQVQRLERLVCDGAALGSAGLDELARQVQIADEVTDEWQIALDRQRDVGRLVRDILAIVERLVLDVSCAREFETENVRLTLLDACSRTIQVGPVRARSVTFACIAFAHEVLGGVTLAVEDATALGTLRKLLSQCDFDCVRFELKGELETLIMAHATEARRRRELEQLIDKAVRALKSPERSRDGEAIVVERVTGKLVRVCQGAHSATIRGPSLVQLFLLIDNERGVDLRWWDLVAKWKPSRSRGAPDPNTLRRYGNDIQKELKGFRQYWEQDGDRVRWSPP
ncbi:MAG: hypothetical protein HY292_03240 [Planctomycetes bacterium]|nr:hypothetical protein [Planctomycetota bacterium]